MLIGFVGIAGRERGAQRSPPKPLPTEARQSGRGPAGRSHGAGFMPTARGLTCRARLFDGARGSCFKPRIADDEMSATAYAGSQGCRSLNISKPIQRAGDIFHFLR